MKPFINISQYMRDKKRFLEKFHKTTDNAIEKEKEFGNSEFRRLVKERKKIASGRWLNSEPVRKINLTNSHYRIYIKNSNNPKNTGLPPHSVVRVNDIFTWGWTKGITNKTSLLKIKQFISKYGSSPSNYVTKNRRRRKIAEFPIYETTMNQLSTFKRTIKLLNAFFRR
jgi:hypothetical protein